MAFSRQHIVATVPGMLLGKWGARALGREGNRARVLPDTYLTPRLGSLKVSRAGHSRTDQTREEGRWPFLAST